jgi:hypothetical protein
MSTNHDTRTFGLQLPLPLPEARPTTGPVAVPDPAPEDDRVASTTGQGWRLDEHTRQVGRRGIAEARARLRAGSSRAA